MQLTIPNNYELAIQFMFEQLPMFSKVGGQALNPSLDKIIAFCKKMDHPGRKFKSIHIAGTNGKGSTSHILAACMQTAGYKTGLYTSPHLIDLRERIRINGEMMQKDSLLTFIQSYWDFINELKPSYFELNVAMAFWYFAKEEVDIAIIETGLGGRWDSTNVITPILSIITNISLDHTQILGNTLAEIAGEKAGIIKKNVPVIIGKSQDETEPVFSKYAILNNAQLIFADVMFDGVIINTTPQFQFIKIVDKRKNELFDIHTDLLGNFQIENIITALTSIIKLEALGWNVNLNTFAKAISQVKKISGLSGRWDWIQESPIIITDVGHNPAGFRIIADQLNHPNLRDKKKIIVAGFVADKDVKEALNLLPKDAYYVLSQAQVPRALPYEKLKEIADELQLNNTFFPTVTEAVKEAIALASTDDLILITGSFFIVGEALEFLNQIKQNKK